MISKCCKLAQKENKTRHDYVDKGIRWELGQKLKFEQTNKWNMQNLESVLENETHKILWDLEIQMDHLISAWRPDLMIVNKKRTSRLVDFAVPADHWVKLKESKKRDRYLDPAR